MTEATGDLGGIALSEGVSMSELLPTALVVLASSTAGLCGHIVTHNNLPASSWGIYIGVFRDSGDRDAPLTTGVYAIGVGAAPDGLGDTRVSAFVRHSDDECRNLTVGSRDDEWATAGSITVTSLTPEGAVVLFDLTFPGGRLRGTIDAAGCVTGWAPGEHPEPACAP